MPDIVVTGATGYVGSALTRALVSRGHRVRGVVRAGRERALPAGVEPIVADAVHATSYASQLSPRDTLVQLVGTPHPSPRKAAEFLRVDLPSGLVAVDAAQQAGIAHLVYVSVAHPAPIMQAYIDVRTTVEARICNVCAQGTLSASILRPWYVLGPGHRWPLLLTPLYALGERVPQWRDSARRLGLVTHAQMIRALVAAIEAPSQASDVRIWDVPEIRRQGSRIAEL